MTVAVSSPKLACKKVSCRVELETLRLQGMGRMTDKREKYLRRNRTSSPLILRSFANDYRPKYVAFFCA